MYFKYNWSCICILYFCKNEILFQNTFQVKLCSMLWKKCYQIDFFTVVISATLATFEKVRGHIKRYCSSPQNVWHAWRNYVYWMQTSSNCHCYCLLWLWLFIWTITVDTGHWTVVLTVNMNDYCFYSVMHKNTHTDITYIKNYFTECWLAVTVTFQMNNYCGLLCLCLKWMIDYCF